MLNIKWKTNCQHSIHTSQENILLLGIPEHAYI